MAAYDLEEQEQLAELKAWWNQYGNLVTWVVLAVAVTVAGWQGWNWYQRNQSAQAALIYGAVQRAAGERDMPRIKAATGELLEKYSGTAYAPLAAMLAGKASFETGDLKTAKAQFAWAVEHGKDELRDLARLRLASVLVDEKAYDEALKTLAEPENAAFATRFHEMRGDTLVAQGKPAEAKAAYRSAIEKADGAAVEKTAKAEGASRRASAYKEFLQQKLDSLGDAK